MVRFRVKKKIRIPKTKPLEVSFKIRREKRISEFLIEKIIALCGLLAVVFVVFIFAYLLIESIPFFVDYNFLAFLTGTEWNPTSPTSPSYGFIPLLYGTAIVTGVSLIIAVPIGLISAMYISQIASDREREILKPLIEILAGIPSVVYGFFAFAVLSGVIQAIFGNYLRLNAFVASVILSVMAIPTIVSISEDALTAVPKGFKEASLALGASNLETLLRVTVPSAKSGILASIMLGLGRAIGETMAVLMVAGNSPIIAGLFNPVLTLTGAPAIEMGEVAYGSLHYHALFALCLMLLIISIIINVSTDYISGEKKLRLFKRKKKTSTTGKRAGEKQDKADLTGKGEIVNG